MFLEGCVFTRVEEGGQQNGVCRWSGAEGSREEQTERGGDGEEKRMRGAERRGAPMPLSLFFSPSPFQLSLRSLSALTLRAHPPRSLSALTLSADYRRSLSEFTLSTCSLHSLSVLTRNTDRHRQTQTLTLTQDTNTTHCHAYFLPLPLPLPPPISLSLSLSSWLPAPCSSRPCFSNTRTNTRPHAHTPTHTQTTIHDARIFC